MVRRIAFLAIITLLVVMFSPLWSTQAQDGPQASTLYQLNMRSGPGGEFDVVAVLDANSPLFLEARNQDTSWVLGYTADGNHRGWLAAIYLSYVQGFAAVRLPVSAEVVTGGGAPVAESAPANDSSGQENAAPASGSMAVYPTYQLNMRSGPGTNFGVVGVLDGGVKLIPEARTGDTSWILAHTPDGSLRGWLAALYIRVEGGSVANLPVSDERIEIAPAAPATNDVVGSSGTGNDAILAPISENINYDGVDMQGYDANRIRDIDLMAVPIVGDATGRSRIIFQQGQALGNNANVLTKVGDCSSEHWYFLSQFAWGEYNLGDYGYLQGVINHFGESLAYGSQATSNGFNSNTVGAPEYANPNACPAGESPLTCEYQLVKPAVSIIMFGTSDLLVMNPYQFDFFMRSLVNQTIERGIIPILSTFPGNLSFWNKTLIYNQIVVRIAWDYDIPLINLFRALEALPNQGLENDGFHLGEPLSGQSCNLVGEYLNTGYATRNLVTLQTLHNVWQGAMQ